MSELLGYLAIGRPGCCLREVLNNCRTLRYMEEIECGNIPMENVPKLPLGFEIEPGCCCEEFDKDAVGCQTFAEGGWNAPWNDPRMPRATQNALGFLVESFTLTRGFVSLSQRSREFGRRTVLPGTRVGTIEGWAFGSGAESTDWLMEWLSATLAAEVHCGLCDSLDLQVWRYCSCAGDSDLRGERILTNAGGFEVDDITDEWNEDNGVTVSPAVARRFRITFEVGDGEAQVPGTMQRRERSPWTIVCGDCDDLCPPCVDDGIRNTEVTEYTPRIVGEVALRGDGVLCPLDFDPVDYNAATWELEVTSLLAAPDGSDVDCPLRIHLVHDGADFRWVPDRLSDFPNDGSKPTGIPCGRIIEISDITYVNPDFAPLTSAECCEDGTWDPGPCTDLTVFDETCGDTIPCPCAENLTVPNSGEGCLNVFLRIDGNDLLADAQGWDPATDLPVAGATVYVDQGSACLDFCGAIPSRPAADFDVIPRTWAPDGWSIPAGFPAGLTASDFRLNQDTSPITQQVLVRTLNPGSAVPEPTKALCSSVVTLDRPITADVSCWKHPSRVSQEVVTIPLIESYSYRFTDLSIAAGSSPLVNARLAVFGAEEGDPRPDIDPEFWACVEPCAELRIVEIPAGCALRYVQGTLVLDCGGKTTPAGPWLDPLTRWDSPRLQGANRWHFVLYLPCGLEFPAAADGSWAVEVTASELH